MFNSDTLSPAELAMIRAIQQTPDYSLAEVRFYLSMKKSVHVESEATLV